MSGTTDDRYFEWLYSHVGAARNRNPARSYWELLRQLYIKEFVWLIANDDNRVADGVELRIEFLDSQGIDEPSREWMELGCSMLEMMIALARRAAFEDGRSSVEWFWEMVTNLGLETYTDRVFNSRVAQLVDETLDLVIYRNYSPDGVGGLFPLRGVETDQRKVELRYQLAAYVLDRASY